MNSNDKFQDFILKNCENAMERLGYKSAMVSLIGMWKENCISKEEFDIEYGITNTDEKNEKDVKQERNDYTVGEDLETFAKRIKIGDITKETIPEDGEYKSSNLLCLLNTKERKQLDMKDSDYLETFIHGENADVSEEEWKKTEYKHLKFSKSIAFRRTYVIDTKFVSERDHEYGQALSDEYWSAFSKTSASVVSKRVQKIGDYDYSTDNDSSVINGGKEDRSVDILTNFGDCEILCVAVHNFQINESIEETFYALLYGSKPDEPELPFAYISMDFVKRVLKTLKKPRHHMSANNWLKGLKTQRFISLADQFTDIDDSHIKLIADVINKRPNSHFETSSRIVELGEIQVCFICFYKNVT